MENPFEIDPISGDFLGIGEAMGFPTLPSLTGGAAGGGLAESNLTSANNITQNNGSIGTVQSIILGIVLVAGVFLWKKYEK